MRLASPTDVHVPTSPRERPAGSLSGKLECLHVVDEEAFIRLYGPAECTELERLSGGPFERINPADLLRGGARFDTVEGIFTSWGMPPLDESMLDRFPRLRVVFYAAGTIKTIVTNASWRRGVRITTAAWANAQPVAEFTLAAIVFSLKHVWQRSYTFRKTCPARRHAASIPGCYGTTVGLLALGKVGQRVAERLREMDVHVVAHDPYVSREVAEQLGVRLCPIEEVFASAEVVSCHLPLHAGTAKLIDAALLRRMKPGATFINTARGAVVNERDLIAVLTERPDLFAVLDTILEEPPPEDSALLRLENAIVTPHLAGSMGRECRRMGVMMVDELQRYLAGDPLLGEVREQDLAILA